jgi:SAM-dependent methyltransferase
VGDHDPGQPLASTGERTVPDVAAENYWFRRHEAAYTFFAGHLAAGDAVLDCGLGEGYGAALLAATGAYVLGLDCDLATARHAHRRYSGLAVLVGNAVDLPLQDGRLDAVVSAQVVEHLWDQAASVHEAARVLRPGGRLLLSTPNRATFPPGNPWHTRELDPADLGALLGLAFVDPLLLGVHHGPRLRALDASLGGLVAGQLSGGPETWSRDLAAAVESVTAADFVITPRTEGALDLVAIASPPG